MRSPYAAERRELMAWRAPSAPAAQPDHGCYLVRRAQVLRFSRYVDDRIRRLTRR